MNQEIRHPATRSCDDCGREERWHESEEVWRVRADGVGEVFCIHDWDITGEFKPVDR